jgi:ELWxxDGT repeat protein
VLVGDIDADPEPEILVTALATGPLYAFNGDGTPVDGWPTRDEAGSVYPGLGNLTDDAPGFEVVTGTWGIRNVESRLQAHAGDGSLLAGWPRGRYIYIDQPPTLADIDGDGIDEIFINEEDSIVHAFRTDGSLVPGWREGGHMPWSQQRVSTAAAGDLDGDGRPEIVIAAQGWLAAYRPDGSDLPGFPFRTSDTAPVDEYPVIGDVDGDGEAEIVVVDTAIEVVARTGIVERKIPLAGSITYGTAPALADLDSDGAPEIVVEGDGWLDALRGDGTHLLGFPVSWGNYWLDNGAPVVGDVDGDARPDIVLVDGPAGVNAGEIRAYDTSGQLLAGFPKTPPIGSGASAPALADVDGDGRNEIIVAGSDSKYGGYFDSLWVYDLGGGPSGRVEWGQFMGGPQHQGRYGAPVMPAAPIAATGPAASSPAALLKDIAAGSASSAPAAPAALGDLLLFRASDESSAAELWRTDGTTGGTTRVADIRAGGAGSDPRELTAVNGTVYFVADDGIHGSELWRTDGTAAGTALVKDIWPGAPGSDPHELTAVGSTLYFVAWDGVTGYELWRSDGTAAGTALVKDIVVGSGIVPNGAGSSADPFELTNVAGALFFAPWSIDSTVQTSGRGLFRTDGTAAGTRMFGNEYLSPDNLWVPIELEAGGGAVYFTDGDRVGRSDGTDAGSRWIADPFYGGDGLTGELTNVNGTLFFRALEGGYGTELWRADAGAAAMVTNLAPDAASAAPGWLTPVGASVYFAATNGSTGFELWRSDGTAAGTTLVEDIRPGGASSSPRALARVGTDLFFSADDGTTGHELWHSDGTAAGTALVQDVAPGPRSSRIAWFARAGETLFFAADDGTAGQELWALPLAGGGGTGDVVPPTVALTAPAAGAYRGDVALMADAADDVAVDHVDFLVEGSVVATDATAPYTVVWSSATGTDGTKTVTARAVDGSGNERVSAGRTITIDNTAPRTTITGEPSGTTTSRAASFSFAADDPAAAFGCSLDGSAFAPCTSPATYSGLADGTHTFRVRATDPIGNVEQAAASRSWAIDATPPETTIDSGPSGTVRSRTATFFFSSNEVASFQCSLDGAAWTGCTSPTSYDHLRRDTHTFRVRATDQAGNVDASPASRTWTVG